jgi:ketosteroid isomerase-like protein
MGTQENAELVRRGYAAFSAGDIATLTEVIAEDAVWKVPGSNPMSGEKQGRDAILGYFGELMTASDGTFTVTLQDVVAGHDHTVGLQRDHAERNNKTDDQDAVLVFTIQDGRITAVQEFREDTARSDDFWS